MSTPRAQLNNDGTAEMVEPQEFSGYYIVNGRKVDPHGNPWKGDRKPAAKAPAAAEQVGDEVGTSTAVTDPVTGKPK